MKLSMNTWFLSRKNAPNWPFVSGVNSTWTKYQPANEDLKKLTKCSVSQECRTSHVDHARSSSNINGLSSIYRKSWIVHHHPSSCKPSPLQQKLGSLVPLVLPFNPCPVAKRPSASFCERKPFATEPAKNQLIPARLPLGGAGSTGNDSAGARATASCGAEPFFETATLWLCQNSYWKWWFIVDFPIENGDFP